MLEVINASKTFAKGTPNEHKALDHLNLSLKEGEFVTILGSNGAGKSTLFNAICGNFLLDEGSVILDGKNISYLPEHQRSASIGRLFQDPMKGTAPNLTIEENLAMASMIGRGRRKVPMEERIRKALCMVGLKDVEKRYPVELSLGECRRVELARAIINSPSVLVLDELTASLDEDTIWDLFHLIGELNRLGTTVIMATHAKNFVNLMRKRVITLVDGRIFGDVRNGRYGDVM